MSPQPSSFDQQLPSRVYSEEDRQLRRALIIEAILRDPGPDAMTLWSSYARADNCNFWNPFSPDRSSYECSAFLLRPTGINLTNAWAYGMFCNFFLTAIPVVVFRRMPLTCGASCVRFSSRT